MSRRDRREAFFLKPGVLQDKGPGSLVRTSAYFRVLQEVLLSSPPSSKQIEIPVCSRRGLQLTMLAGKAPLPFIQPSVHGRCVEARNWDCEVYAAPPGVGSFKGRFVFGSFFRHPGDLIGLFRSH